MYVPFAHREAYDVLGTSSILGLKKLCKAEKFFSGRQSIHMLGVMLLALTTTGGVTACSGSQDLLLMVLKANICLLGSHCFLELCQTGCRESTHDQISLTSEKYLLPSRRCFTEHHCKLGTGRLSSCDDT